ncbi:hypothetical protein AVEN_92655-1 [Araneus ventricosus]|uniref:DDE-1 domain-containing protein n=1 Tax=Araneus ventricosus TaxID=182803 RepID=A0A4Y2AI26_ARAVE|nr:hypothetical protein AVEN_92655-1 [Araneus ventricosus]
MASRDIEIPRNATQLQHLQPVLKYSSLLAYAHILVFVIKPLNHIGRLSKPSVGEKHERKPTLNPMSESVDVGHDHDPNTWFTAEITNDWFHTTGVLAIKKDHAEYLRILEDEVKVLVLLNNAPAHPDEEKLCYKDEKIKRI